LRDLVISSVNWPACCRGLARSLATTAAQPAATRQWPVVFALDSGAAALAPAPRGSASRRPPRGPAARRWKAAGVLDRAQGQAGRGRHRRRAHLGPARRFHRFGACRSRTRRRHRNGLTLAGGASRKLVLPRAPGLAPWTCASSPRDSGRPRRHHLDRARNVKLGPIDANCEGAGRHRPHRCQCGGHGRNRSWWGSRRPTASV